MSRNNTKLKLKVRLRDERISEQIIKIEKLKAYADHYRTMTDDRQDTIDIFVSLYHDECDKVGRFENMPFWKRVKFLLFGRVWNETNL